MKTIENICDHRSPGCLRFNILKQYKNSDLYPEFWLCQADYVVKNLDFIKKYMKSDMELYKGSYIIQNELINKSIKSH